MATDSRRAAKIEIGLDQTDLDRDIASARRKMRTWGRDMKRNKFGGSDGSSRGGMARAKRPESAGRALWGGLAGAAAAVGAVSILTDGAGAAMDFERALTRLQISGSMTDQQLASMRDEVKRVSDATGVARSEILRGAAAYTAMTGDAKGAQEAVQLFAEIAAGSGASMDDIAGAAAAMRQNLKIDPKDFRKGFDILVTQGKLGAVEIANLADQLSSVAPQFSQFGGSRTVEGMAELGAMLQVARQAFASAEEEATGFNGIMTQLSRNSKKLQKYGINVFDKSGKARNLLSILKEIGANEKLMSGRNLLDSLGEEKAVRAARKVIEELEKVEAIKRESLGSDAVAKDNAKFQASSAGKFAKSMEAAKNAVADLFTPERIAAFADALAGAVQVLSGAASFINEVSDGFTGMLDAYDKWASNKYLDEMGGIRGVFRELAGVGGIDRMGDRMNRVAQSQLAANAMMTMGSAGAGPAGDAYLATRGLTREDIKDELARLTLEQIEKSNKAIAAAIEAGLAKQPVNVNLDGTKVGEKVDNSKKPLPRGRI